MADDSEQTRIERAVLEEILHRHPENLTVPELVRRVSAKGASEREAIEQAVRELSSDGLVRENAGLVVPTRAALRAHALLVWP